jgi:hypothetical protein
VPSDGEWTSLTNYLGGEPIAGGKIKSIGTANWNSPNTGATNESGFSALPSGFRNSVGSFVDIRGLAFFWSATEYDISSAWGRGLTNANGIVYRFFNFYKTFGASVRCLKDTFSIVSIPSLSTSAISSITTTTATSGGNITSDGGASISARGVVWSTSTNPTIALTTKTSDGTGTGSFTSSLTNLTPKTTYFVRAYATNSAGTGYGNEITFTTTDSSSVMGIPCPGTPTVKDIDGNTYNTILIGTQCWTKENLRVTKYRDGTIIPLDESGGTTGNGTGQTWSSRTSGARTVYGHSAANLATYGYLYNWYAVADTKGICPSSWHVPSDAEWTTLINYLGGESVAESKLKSTGTTLWTDPNTGATNESGFSALPGGYRNWNGLFYKISIDAFFWSASEYYLEKDRALSLSTENLIDKIGITITSGKNPGYSVRCLKDTFSIVSIPSLTTTSITAVSTSSATSGGNITSDGGASVTARGVVWSTTTNPTIALTTKTSNGTGTGSFTSSLTNLTPKTTYYVRAYATNIAGTGYGNEISFTTSDLTIVLGIPCPGTPTVKDIDGNTYNTVQIGTQCWTKENLRVTKYRDGTVIPLDESGGTNGGGNGQTWGSKTTGARTVYGHSASNLATYGYLYNWYSVADSKGLCPGGWHVPRDGEWTTLTTYLGEESVAGGKMKSTGTTLWNSPNTGATNESGFSALPGGFRNRDGSFVYEVLISYGAFFWSSTEYYSGALSRNLYSYGSSVNRIDNFFNGNKLLGASIRCLKDTISIVSISTLTTTAITSINTTSATSGGIITSDGGAFITARGVVWSTTTNPTIILTTKTSDGTGTGSFSSTLTNLTPKTTYYVRAYATNSAGTGYGNEISFTTSDSSSLMGIPCPGTPTVKDIDGNTYNTVQIGAQCWTKENLRVTKYKNGSVIPLDQSGGVSGSLTGQTWRSRTTGARTLYEHDPSNLATYGYLYNWYSVVDSKGLCPNGWHVPSDSEWTTLTTYLGGESVAGGKMKSIGTTYWNIPNIGATNESGFSALPGGFRSSDGSFSSIWVSAFFWSATEYVFNGFAWDRNLNYSNSGVIRYGNDESVGVAVRCLRN